MKKRILAAILMLAMACSLVACGGNGSANNTENTQNESEVNKDTEKESEKESEATGVVYTIKVVDEAGNPVEGAVVQLCKDSCSPAVTNAEGVAQFKVKELSDEYKATIATYPDGTQYPEDYVYFTGGITEVTLTMKAAQ